MAFASSALPAAQTLSLPSIFGDHMVVQAGRPVELWGRDLPGTPVSASLAGEKGRTQAAADGRWALSLPALKPGGPYVLTVDGSSQAVYSDVLVGEVWLGSGQSNMEFALHLSKDRDAALAKAADPQLRVFSVDRASSFTPKEDLSGSWKLSDPSSVSEFSAVAYHFARELREALKVPVGMVAASWGGTPCEDWTPREVLDSAEPYRSLAAEWDRDPARVDLWTRGKDYDLEVQDLRLVKADGSSLSLPLDGWNHSEKTHSTGLLDHKDGSLIYSGVIQGGAWASAERSLDTLGASGTALDARPYEALAFKARGKGGFNAALGQASIVDYDDYASEAFEARPEWTEYRFPLSSFKQGAWGEPAAFTPQALTKVALVAQVPYWPELAGLAYNGMIAPLKPYSMRGVIWYQGESNVGRPGDYANLLTLMVKAWRKAFKNEDLAFLAVQLPNYGEKNFSDGQAHWALLREAQERAMAGLDHAGLAVALDLGDRDEIHPKDKRPVGRRLALLALAQVYGKDVEASGPKVERMVAEGGKLRLTLSHSKGLALKPDLAGAFEVAGKDGAFHGAKAALDGGVLVLWSEGVGQPTAARYAWADDPKAVLFNGEGLPAAPFRLALK